MDRFNNRRYDNSNSNNNKNGGDNSRRESGEFEPVDNCINSVLGQEVELTDEFKVIGC